MPAKQRNDTKEMLRNIDIPANSSGCVSFRFVSFSFSFSFSSVLWRLRVCLLFVSFAV